jgi:hypothetical protein
VKQAVAVIGSELSRLVPVSLALMGGDYAVTLAEAPDVLERAKASALRDNGWLLLLLDGDESVDTCAALLSMQPQTVFVTSPAHEALRRRLIEIDLPVVAEHEGPVPALATLLAMSRWAETSTETPSRPMAPGSAG